MSHDNWYDDNGEEAGRLVPLYVLVNGRTTPRNTTLDLATQVIALPVDSLTLEPEYQDIINRSGDWISVAEIAAYLGRPLTVTKILVDVLLERRCLAVGSPAEARVSDRIMLQTLLDGLQRL